METTNATPKELTPVVRLACPFADENMGLPERCAGTCGKDCPIISRAPGLMPLKDIEFDTCEFEFSHGRAPRNPSDGGPSSWAFGIKGKTIFLYGKLGDCKRTAKRIAQFKGEDRVVVLP